MGWFLVNPGPSSRPPATSVPLFSILFTLLCSIVAVEGSSRGTGNRTATDIECSVHNTGDSPCRCNNALWETDCILDSNQHSTLPYKDYRRRKFIKFSDVATTNYMNGSPTYNGGANICKWDGLTVEGVEALFGPFNAIPSEDIPVKCPATYAASVTGVDCCCPPGTMSWIHTYSSDDSTGCRAGCGSKFYHSPTSKEDKCDSDVDVNLNGAALDSPVVLTCASCPAGRYNPHYSNPFR